MHKLKSILLIIGAMTMLVCSSYKRDRTLSELCSEGYRMEQMVRHLANKMLGMDIADKDIGTLPDARRFTFLNTYADDEIYGAVWPGFSDFSFTTNYKFWNAEDTIEYICPDNITGNCCDPYTEKTDFKNLAVNLTERLFKENPKQLISSIPDHRWFVAFRMTIRKGSIVKIETKKTEL